MNEKAILRMIDGMLKDLVPVENSELEAHDYAVGYLNGYCLALRDLKGWIEAGAQL